MGAQGSPREETAPLKENLRLLRIAASFLKARVRGKLLAAMVPAVGLMLLTGWLGNVPALLLGRVLDQVVEGTATSFAHVWPPLLLVFGSLAARELFTWLRRLLVETAATKLERDEFVEVVGHLLRVDLLEILRQRTGGLNLKMDRSVEGVVKLVKLFFMDFLPISITAGIAIYLVFAVNMFVALIMLGAASLAAMVTWWQILSQKGIRLELFRAKEGINAKLVELLWGIDYVRASGSVDAEVANARSLADRFREKEFRHHRSMMTFDAGKNLVEGSGFVAVIALGAWLAATGSVSKGEVLTFAMLYGSVSAPLRELHRIVDEMFEAVLRVNDLAVLYALPLDRGLLGRTPPLSASAGPIISCRELSVSFSASSSAGRAAALSGVTVTIERGESVGVAGPSGSGKSTFARVILGLLADYEGSAVVFGSEVRELDKRGLARLIGYVPQTAFLIHGSISDNVLYGADEGRFAETDVSAALEAAQLEEWEVNAPVLEQGRNLSGGEKQRLVLARVLIGGAELLVLDEATAALDSASERLVQRAIENVVRDRTAIIIAHRLSTLRHVDRVLVFSDGAIVQDGSFAELAEQAGLFQQLLHGQDAAENVEA